MEARGAPLAVEELVRQVDGGEVDTVVACLTDVQGRLQGKRLHARYFVDEVLQHGTEACNYLLAVDVDMNTVGGYAISSWERGYGDFVLQPDLATMRRASWLPATAIVQCDVLWLDGAPVVQSPRQILRAQVDSAAALGFSAVAGTELEFMVFEDTFEQAWERDYRGPDAGEPVQRRLLGARHRAGGAAAARHPQPHVRRGPAGRVGQGRVQLRPARDRLPL